MDLMLVRVCIPIVSQYSNRGRTRVLKLRTLMSECPVCFGPDLVCECSISCLLRYGQSSVYVILS